MKIDQNVKRSRRLRKKLYVNEYRVYGFEVSLSFKEMDESALDPFLDEIVNFVESRNLMIAGGGGIGIIGGSATLNQTTVSSNSTSGSYSEGGGIFTSGETTLTQSTITNNTAVSGAGGLSVSLFNVSNDATLFNTILSGNTTTGGGTEGDFNDRSASPSSELNVFNSLFGDDVAEITGFSINNVFNSSPKLGPLQNNGGPTLSHLPNSNSPALDAGDNTAAAAFTNDQRDIGFTRIINSVVDIGAVEAPILPDQSNIVKRAEIVKPLLMAALLEPEATTGSVYDDVASNAFNATWINRFKSEGLSEGCSASAPNRFCPNNVVTKEQLAKMILQVKGIPPATTLTGFYSDVTASSFNANYIEKLETEGFSTGCDVGKFCPKDAVTIEMFNNILNAAFP